MTGTETAKFIYKDYTLVRQNYIYLKRNIEKLIKDINKQFSDIVKDNEAILFDEVLIIRITQEFNYSVVLHYPERKDISPINEKEVASVIQEFIMNDPMGDYSLLNDQDGSDFDYMTRDYVKEKKIFILLNNIKFSMDEIYRKYSQEKEQLDSLNIKIKELITHSLDI